ncbi:MAG: NADH-quinone oxidoreductase subunit L [Ignavibacteria bacterium]|jgi:NADH-quinone oxidoreductase subunit L|nr:NADH-quinone oxidoreductase subunit L [Ignavibacteria bacterium]
MNFDSILSLSTAILILPLISFLILIFNQKRVGRAAGWIALAFLLADFVLAVIVAYNRLVLYADQAMIQWKFDWFSLGSTTIKLGIGVDNLTAVMLIVVTLISSLVHLFSTEYMKDDPRYPRFFAYLGLFSFSMLGIVLANNFFNMYIFWELVGISSYLLIGFWYEKDTAANANKKAFITNRIGDFGMLIGILICFSSFGTFMFDDIFANIGAGHLPFDSGTMLTVAGICLFCGAIGKSAQFPLHVWLPDAMEGPTPVSALIHAATMVAAGVYLTARIFPLLSADALVFVAYIGAITAFMAATIAITQTDFKRVLAFSTVSQLGYMIMGIGVGAWSLGFMHLVTHAWFKACLFLTAGSVIHAMHASMHHKGDHHTDPQDIRNMGGLRKTMPITYFTYLFACIAIAGVPFTSGFLSKDGILAGTLAFANLSGHWFIPFAGFTAAFMTAFYMFRLLIVSFHGKPSTEIAAQTKENKWSVVFPLMLLAGLSFWFFYSPNPFDANSGWFLQKIQTPASVVPAEYQFDFITALPEGHGEHGILNEFAEELHHMHVPAMLMSLLIAGCGILLSYLVYQWKKINADKVADAIQPLYKLSFNKWYIDEIYERSFIGGTVALSKLLSWFDNKIVDGLVNLCAKIMRGLSWFIGKFDNVVVDGAVNLTAWIVGLSGRLGRQMQTGSVQTYIAFSIIILMIIVYFVA